jgi:hypothetical protein
VAINTQVPRSPGWWMKRLSAMLADQRRASRLQLLTDYLRGNPPLPEGAENAREAYANFQKKARSNFSELVVSAVSQRMTPVGFKTAVDADASGDAEVGQMWTQVGLDVLSADVHDLMLGLGESYVIVGAVSPNTEAPVVTCEDPRWMVAETDPAEPETLLAAMKVLRDDVGQEDRAYLYLPAGDGRDTAQVWVAVRKATGYEVPGSGAVYVPYTDREPRSPRLPFDGRSWSWDETRSGALDHPRIPVVKFTNKYGLGEFETHRDLLDRINHQILQRMTIAVMQAFRQRAVKGLPLVWPEGHPQAGQVIDYERIFTADPAALWQLPKDAEMWESAVNDLSPILNAVKDDLEHLAAVTSTPMHMLHPAGENQSAEGASLSREGLVFKVEDRIARTGRSWAQVMSLVLLHAGQPERAVLPKLKPMWAPANRLSLAERADAATKLKDVLPRRTLLIDVLGYAPDRADEIMTEITDDKMFDLELQNLQFEAQLQQQRQQQEQQQELQAKAVAALPAGQQPGQPGQPGQQGQQPGQQRALPPGRSGGVS